MIKTIGHLIALGLPAAIAYLFFEDVQEVKNISIFIIWGFSILSTTGLVLAAILKANDEDVSRLYVAPKWYRPFYQVLGLITLFMLAAHGWWLTTAAYAWMKISTFLRQETTKPEEATQ